MPIGLLQDQDTDRLGLHPVWWMTEPRNIHQDWCNIWTSDRLPCNCGAGFAPRAQLGAEHPGFAGGA